MKLKSFPGLISIMCVLLLSSLLGFLATIEARAEDPRSNGVVERTPTEDPSCDAVNRAYQNTINHGRVQQSVYEVGPTSSALYAEYRYVQQSVYGHQIQEVLWRRSKRPLFQTNADGRPVFTHCRLENTPNPDPMTEEYSARWQRGKSTATIYVWIKDGKSYKIERQFDPGSSPFPFANTFELYTDDPNIPVPIDERPSPIDESCAEVNSAFGRTVDTARYSYVIAIAKGDGQASVRESARVNDNAVYLKSSGGAWRRHDLPIQRLTTPSGALFYSCERQPSTAGEIHYTGKLHQAETTVPIDIWISGSAGKFTRTLRDYTPQGQRPRSRTVEQTFDYRQSSGSKPSQYVPDIASMDIWSIGTSLQ